MIWRSSAIARSTQDHLSPNLQCSSGISPSAMRRSDGRRACRSRCCLARRIFADLLWPVLVALGIEHVRIAPGITASRRSSSSVIPYSHSLLTLVAAGRALRLGRASRVAHAAAHRTCTCPIDRARSLLVVSHWVLDVVTHIPGHAAVSRRSEVRLGLVELDCRHDRSRNGDVRDRRVDLRARDEAARRDRHVGVRRRHRVSVRRASSSTRTARRRRR